MNPTELLKKIKRRLGVRTLKLSLDDNELLDIITGETVDTFSNHIPYVFEDYIFDTDKVEGTRNTYYIDDCLERHHGVKCLGIYDISLTNGTSLTDMQMDNLGNYNPVPRHGGAYMGGGLESLIMTGALANITSALEFARDIFKFVAPNKVTLVRHDIQDAAIVKFQATHAKDLSTIAPTYEEEFFKLAILNIKIALYAEMKYYDNMDTAFGSIQLKIDEWASAENDRESLLKEWADKFIVNREDVIFVI